MVCQQPLKRAGQVLFLLALGAVACQRSQPPVGPPSPGPAPTGTQSRDSAFWVSGWGYCLRPVKAGPPAGADRSREVWRDLFPGMAKDAKTRELLTRLHGGWPAELIALDAKQANDKAAFKAPPPAGAAVALRVADLQLKDVNTDAGPVPFREIAFGRVVQIRDAVIGELPLGKVEPRDGDALDLAIEEYVLRQAPGFVARRATGPGTSFEDDQQLSRAAEEVEVPAGVEDQHRDLDRRIEDYANRARAYYGAAPKP